MLIVSLLWALPNIESNWPPGPARCGFAFVDYILVGCGPRSNCIRTGFRCAATKIWRRRDASGPILRMSRGYASANFAHLRVNDRKAARMFAADFASSLVPFFGRANSFLRRGTPRITRDW